jgi:hypothetical protein
MRNGDVRRACLALVHHRVSALAPSADPLPVALGFHLARGQSSLNAMAALCAGALADAATPVRWQPSAALRALLGEYGAVCLERHPAERAAHRRGVLRSVRAADVLH